jgi:MFS-type transporter involved in bile tolerance (Atg22 family)
MAMYSMFGNVSRIINPMILGLIAQTLGPREALQFSTGMTLVGLILVVYMARRGSEDERPPE